MSSFLAHSPISPLVVAYDRVGVSGDEYGTPCLVLERYPKGRYSRLGPVVGISIGDIFSVLWGRDIVDGGKHRHKRLRYSESSNSGR